MSSAFAFSSVAGLERSSNTAALRVCPDIVCQSPTRSTWCSPTCRSFAGKNNQLGFARESKISLLFIGEGTAQHSTKDGILDSLRIVGSPYFTDLLDPPLSLLASVCFEAASPYVLISFPTSPSRRVRSFSSPSLAPTGLGTRSRANGQKDG